MMMRMARNWRPTRQRISFCDVLGLVPRIMFQSPKEHDEHEEDGDRRQVIEYGLHRSSGSASLT